MPEDNEKLKPTPAPKKDADSYDRAHVPIGGTLGGSRGGLGAPRLR